MHIAPIFCISMHTDTCSLHCYSRDIIRMKWVAVIERSRNKHGREVSGSILRWSYEPIMFACNAESSCRRCCLVSNMTRTRLHQHRALSSKVFKKPKSYTRKSQVHVTRIALISEDFSITAHRPTWDSLFLFPSVSGHPSIEYMYHNSKNKNYRFEYVIFQHQKSISLAQRWHHTPNHQLTTVITNRPQSQKSYQYAHDVTAVCRCRLGVGCRKSIPGHICSTEKRTCTQSWYTCVYI